MQNAAHTPGPWKTETIGDTIRVVDQEGNDCGYIGDGYNATHRANIALMAAAPELLEALEKCAAFINNLPDGGDWELFEDAEDIIKKAKGE